MGKKSLGQKSFEQPKCSVCGVLFKNHKFVGGKIIKNICNCNTYLLDEEAKRIRERKESKPKSPKFNGVITMDFK